MLEADAALRTWDLRALPSAWEHALAEQVSSVDAQLSGVDAQVFSVDARALPDHRLAYLEYEGPVSGGRGEVTCCDRGSYQLLAQTPDRLVVRLEGRLLGGVWQLRRQADLWRLEPATS
jgi:hypothetical protein